MGRIIAIDYGKKRTGLAIADPVTRIPLPWQVVATTGNPDGDAETVHRTLTQSGEDIAKIVVGIPFNMDGTVGPQADLTKKFAEKLAAMTGISVTFWDERLSTYEAERKFRPHAEKNISRKHKLRKKSAKPLDAVAAAVILEAYLNQSNNA